MNTEAQAGEKGKIDTEVCCHLVYLMCLYRNQRLTYMIRSYSASQANSGNMNDHDAQFGMKQLGGGLVHVKDSRDHVIMNTEVGASILVQYQTHLHFISTDINVHIPRLQTNDFVEKKTDVAKNWNGEDVCEKKEKLMTDRVVRFKFSI